MGATNRRQFFESLAAIISGLFVAGKSAAPAVSAAPGSSRYPRITTFCYDCNAPLETVTIDDYQGNVIERWQYDRDNPYTVSPDGRITTVRD